MERLVEQSQEKLTKKSFDILVEKGTFVDGRQIKDVMWPVGALITEVLREDGESIIPDGKTRLQEGDRLTILVESSDFGETEEFLSHLTESNSEDEEVVADQINSDDGAVDDGLQEGAIDKDDNADKGEEENKSQSREMSGKEVDE